jgi:hypothetical membrane protein
MSTINPKVTSAALAAALVTILVWALERWAGVSLPEMVQVAVLTVVTFAAGWLKTDTRL